MQADIRALPFRAGAVDAVIDLSVLDHVEVAEVGDVIAGYRRVPRRDGVLLLVFWQHSAAVRLRLRLKRVLAGAEKQGQRYSPRAVVRISVCRAFAVLHEFAAGTLLVLPQLAVGAVLGRLPEVVGRRLVERLAAFEVAGALRPLLPHLSGLYGLVARAR